MIPLQNIIHTHPLQGICHSKIPLKRNYFDVFNHTNLLHESTRKRLAYRGSPLSYSGRDWCTPPSAWSRKETRSIPVVSVRGGSAGRASATLGSKWREAVPCGGKPAACRPGSGGWWRSCWAAPGSSRPFPVPPWPPSFSSVFSPKHPPLSLPTSPLRRPASTREVSSRPDLWRKINLSRSWWWHQPDAPCRW